VLPAIRRGESNDGHCSLLALSQEELATHGRRVRPVKLNMAVHACAVDQTCIDLCAQRPDWLAEAAGIVDLVVRHPSLAVEAAARAVDRARVPRTVVAVLAEIRRMLP